MQPGLGRERPRRVHARAERREHADPPVAELVAKALDDDLPVVRYDAGHLALLVEIRTKVADGELVERALLGQAGVVPRVDIAEEGADGPAELDGPPEAVAVPERHLARLAGRGRDDHAVAGDLLDAPRGRAEHEGLSDPALVDHLLVELADPRARGREHAVEAAIGDRPAAGDRQHARAGTRLERARDTVPVEARPQLGELVRRIPAGEHVEHVLEQLARQVGKRVRAPDDGGHLVDRELLDRAHGHDLLREYVDGVPGDARLLDERRFHALGDHRRAHEVAPVLREYPSTRRFAHAMAGASDALEAAGNGRRRLDLHHEVDGTHVDAELEARGGHQRRQLARLQRVLDLEPLLARDRPVVGPHELLARELVEPRRQPLRKAAGVDEDQGRAVLSDQVEQHRGDGRPDRVAGLGIVARGLPGLAHVLDRDDHLQLERLADAGVDDAHRPRAPVALAAEEPGDLVERPLRGRQPDALRRLRAEPLEPLQRERQVRAALGAGHGMDLVDDHVLDGRQHLPGARREHQVERLGSGDEHVGRVTHDVAPVGLRRVARAGGDAKGPHLLAPALRLDGDPRERSPQVALDVVGERLQRRDVEHAATPRLVRGQLGRHESVDRPQERGQCLAGSGRGEDQGVLAERDSRPSLVLRCRRRVERGLEPGTRKGRKGREAVQVDHQG